MESIKHYKIQEKIGSGGMGEVYKAFDQQLEREVAIKIMHHALSQNEQNAQRLVREARAAAKLVHPNVVTIYEVGKDEIGRYIVMEYVNGSPLSDLVYKEGPFEERRAIKITVQVLRALSLAHKMGILHRDIKTENVLINENEQAKVLDFGIAKMIQKAGITVAGEVLGTVEFMAPEQMLGEEIDQRCDIYSAGVMLYQILTKNLPFRGQNPVEILFKKLNEEPVAVSYYNKKISPHLDQIVLKALKHSKNDRWASAEDMINALENLLAPQTQAMPPVWPGTPGFDFDPDEDQTDQDKSPQLRQVFIGREKEFKKLTSAFHKIPMGEGQTVILSGEAGVGKSTLANQFRNYIEHQNTWVLYGTCLYQEGMDAYLPYIDALRGFFSRENSKITEVQRIDLRDMVREKVPILTEFTERFSTTFLTRSSINGAENNESNTNLFEGLYLLLATISEIRPVVLVIDDLQWADGASLRLFHYLSRQIINNQIMLFGISRTDRYDLQENGKPKLIVDMMARMRREGIIQELAVNRLTRDDCDTLVDKSLGDTAFSENFYEIMYRETKGNPFFVVETIKLLKEKKSIFSENNIWVDKKVDFKSEVPNRVEDIFIRRLSALSEEDREMLQIASVIGYKFDPSLLALILEVTKLTLLKKLQKIERDLQIIASTDRFFQFEHPMLADLLYGEIPGALSREYHLMIADELEKIHGRNFGAVVGDAAQHFRRGGSHEKSIPLLYQAGVRAFDISAYREAGLFFEDALDSIEKAEVSFPEEISRCEFYFKYGICFEETGNWEEALKAYRILAELSEEDGDITRHVDALMRIGRVHDTLGEWDRAVTYYEKCLSMAEQHNIRNVFSRVHNKMGVYYFHKGDFDQALKYFQKTIHSVDSEFGEFDEAHAYTNVGIIANIIRGEHGVALENFEKALKIYKKRDSRQDQARVYHNIGMFYSDHAQWLESIKAYENCLKLADDVESKHLRALTYLNMGKAYARQKKLVKARNLTEKALKMFKRMSDIISIGEAYQVFGIIYGTQGDFPKAEEYLNNAIQIFESKDYMEGLAQTYETFGTLCHENGSFDRAKEYYLKATNVFKSMNLDSKVKGLMQIIESMDKDDAIFDQIGGMELETKLLTNKYDSTAN